MADRTNNPGTTGNTGSDRSQIDRQNPDLNTEEGGMSGSSGRDSLTDRSRSTGNTGNRGGNTSVTGDEASEEGGMSGSSGRSDRESETSDRQTSTDEGYGSSRGNSDSGSTGKL